MYSLKTLKSNMSKGESLTYEGQLLNHIELLNWKWHDIYQWILSEHSCLRQYEQVLFNALKSNDINGTCLQHLTAHDWRLLGITELTHINILMNSINDKFTISKPPSSSSSSSLSSSPENAKNKLSQENAKLVVKNIALQQENEDLKLQIKNKNTTYTLQQQMMNKLSHDNRILHSQADQYSCMIYKSVEAQNLWYKKEIAYQKQIQDLNVMVNSLNLRLRAARMYPTSSNCSPYSSVSILKENTSITNVNNNTMNSRSSATRTQMSTKQAMTNNTQRNVNFTKGGSRQNQCENIL